jgi:ATP/ADP translocase/HEAT repeat protein/CRP-like cAMP-binding protein
VRLRDAASSRALQRLLAPVVQLREPESVTALLMFAYSCLAMTAYNVVKPVTRSKFIADLGADNIPYVQLLAGLLIGLVMQSHSALAARLPRQRSILVTQGGMVALLVVFRLLFETEAALVSVAFYLLGLLLGVLLISEFWTLAIEIYEARQAKRIFGFIGGGASLGGMFGSGLTTLLVSSVGTENLLLCSAAILGLGLALLRAVLSREGAALGRGAGHDDQEGVGGKEALRLLRESRHLQLISLVIGFSAVGATVIEQQLNMAVEAFKGRDATDAITGFLARVTLYLSAVGFAVQVGLTSRIHRYLGIGFALLVLPVGLGGTALLMLLNAALWAPALARVLDTALRYTVDKTTREILFLPLPGALKRRAKPFVDVSVDRVAKGLGALLVLVLIKPWGLQLGWQQVSYASLAIMVLWMLTALRARREYLTVFRASLERRELRPNEIRLNLADLSTIEALVEELASPDEERALNAIALLEALDKRNLVTPLLLHHASPRVRARALTAIEATRREIAERWLPVVREMLKDESVEVRGAAVHALSVIARESAIEQMRPHLDDLDPRVAVAAAVALAEGPYGGEAEQTLRRLAADTRDAAVDGRREVARGLGQIAAPGLRSLLLPLITDHDEAVAREAIRSARRVAAGDQLFVPALVSLLRHRQLKAEARQTLVAYGEPVVGALVHFLQDAAENPWVRRHIPATLALIPCQDSVDALLAALQDPDAFLRHKAATALERLRVHPGVRVDQGALEQVAEREVRRSLSYLSLLYNLLRDEDREADSLLTRTLKEKLQRSLDRVFSLLGLLYPGKGVLAARWSIERGDPRARAAGLEYLDGLVGAGLRRWLMAAIEEEPIGDKARRANALLRTRVRDVEETLAQLIHDEDPALSAAAIHSVERRQLWALADDLQHVLEHRDARDTHVLEAASWALGGRRLRRERRRAPWLEPLPAIELADRLRHIPPFRGVPVDELLTIAGLGSQIRIEAGRLLYSRGAAAGGVLVLLEGGVSVEEAGAARRLAAPTVLAVAEVVQGLPMDASGRTTEDSIGVRIEAGPFLSLLGDNIELAQGLFQTLFEAQGSERLGRVIRARAAPRLAPVSESLAPLDRVRRLRQSPLFARATAEQLLELAGLAREVPLELGACLFAAGEQPACWLLLSGAVCLEGAEGESVLHAEAGDLVGAWEALGGSRADRRASVRSAGRALRLGREELLDFLQGHIDLLQGMFSALLSPEDPTGWRRIRSGPQAAPPSEKDVDAGRLGV